MYHNRHVLWFKASDYKNKQNTIIGSITSVIRHCVPAARYPQVLSRHVNAPEGALREGVPVGNVDYS